MVAALALLFAMAVDWYSTKQGRDLRLQERRLERIPPTDEGDTAQLRQETSAAAASQERNAWQADQLVDRVILAALLVAVALALAAGFLRAAGKRFEPPRTPSALAAIAAGVAGLLVAYRIVQAPGDDAFAVIEAGPVLAIACLAVLGLACTRALRLEEQGRAFRAPGDQVAAQPQERPAG